MPNASAAQPRAELARRVAGIALRLKLHPNAVRRYRHILDAGRGSDWMERICLIRATRAWTNDLARRERIAAAILKLSKGLDPPVYAAWADPTLLVADNGSAIIKFGEEQPGIRVLAVSEVLGGLTR